MVMDAVVERFAEQSPITLMGAVGAAESVGTTCSHSSLNALCTGGEVRSCNQINGVHQPLEQHDIHN
jgi:hypothetical protein